MTFDKNQQWHNLVKYASPRQWLLLSMIALMLFVVSSFVGLHAKETKPQSEPIALLDRIWPYQMPHKRPLSKQDQEYAEATLIQWLESYLEPEYKVIDQRFFWGERNSAEWVAISKAHALYPENEKGRWRVVGEVRQPQHAPGIGLVRMWKVNIDGGDHYFAIAMTDQPVPGTRGRHLMARFELNKMTDSPESVPLHSCPSPCIQEILDR
jgi:hypothetical protein